MRVLVAGGAGFLGSHICEQLLARGDSVVALDNLSTGRRSNLSHLEADPRMSVVIADVSRPFHVERPFDAVLNFASPASPPAYLLHPLETMAAGSDGTRQLLDIASEDGARYLLASTSEIYGDPTVHPQREDYRGNVDTIGPRSVYDEAKRFAETLTMAYHRAKGTDVAIARLFNTYGPRLSPGDGRVVSNFIVQALEDRPLTVYGDGSQTRSLCYVDDEVRGLIALLDSEITGPVNLGNPDERTVLQIAHVVQEIVGSGSGITYAPLPEQDPVRRCPDITLARTGLGWEPEIELKVGLTRTVEYFASLV
ncbi:MAG TPA: UDP-glucuronic acid decarboxylase family protein [Acidimicrobiales bacterium]